MKKNKISGSAGLKFYLAICLILIAFKLTGLTVIATWNWFWIISPLWIPPAIAMGVLFAILVAFVSITAFLPRKN